MSSQLESSFNFSLVEAIPGPSCEQWLQVENSEDSSHLREGPSPAPSPPSTAMETIGTEGIDLESIDFKTYKMRRLRPYAYQYPTVNISIWDSSENCWSPCRAEKIKLVLANKKLKLERHVTIKEVLDGGLRRVPNGGVLRRVREGDTPSTAADDTLKAFISLHRIQENIIKQLPSSPQSVWIRLESSARVSGQSGPVEILLGPNSRYQLVQTCDLPLGGRPPFLWDNEGLEDIRQIEEDNMGVSLISNGLIQKQEGPSAATRVLRSSRGAEAVFTSRAEINRAPESGIAESEAASNTRLIETVFMGEKSAGTDSSYNMPIPEPSMSEGTSKEESRLEDEQSILARLVEIDNQELELLREKQLLVRKLRAIKSTKGSTGTRGNT
ncbi:uncharacterized protein DFL_005402 [Arthrobotrys flagrans]|uniref:Uncharacterized protein n=1 Tax=Arthrobotrys flagrans TaxID=97331 RepID=A0A437A7M0_ARTFL|nr:hypothetical protein DFL_005402 [Arthrobotrys flagrans]